MGYRSLRECVDDLQRAGQLAVIEQEIDPHLEAAAIQRRVYQARGPAIYFARVRGTRLPMVSNLFGTMERTRFMFRDALRHVEQLIAVKADPGRGFREPLATLAASPTAACMLPKRVRSGPVFAQRGRISDLPQLKSWPNDGGAFITLPQVYTEDVLQPGWQRSNLGMYRIQISGGSYEPDREVGMHYQIHRGIGVHHARALEAKQPLRANIFVGGPPAMTVAAVMPLPEGMSELSFAGALNRRRVRLAYANGALPVHSEADVCISGEVLQGTLKPEGPFGDHLGYYSLTHDFPVLRVEHVWYRSDAIWPFTVVGRPPQEDTSFGAFIHELTAAMIPSVLPGVIKVHAVDAAGVHPLLLALGSERYQPYVDRAQPQELLTQANAILGQGQMSLAKYVLIAARQDNPALDVEHVAEFVAHILERVDHARDLHFQTRTTIDTLDYSGGALNQGSKLVIAAVGAPRRSLPRDVAPDLRLPPGFEQPRVAMPGVLVVAAPAVHDAAEGERTRSAFCQAFSACDAINAYPWVVLVDDSEFTARSLDNFAWVTFTRSNPAVDIDGIEAFTEHKHWGCRGSLVIDARTKPHHAPALEDDPAVTRRVDALAAPGGPLHGLI